VACEYAKVTGDYGIFDVQEAYLESRSIPDGKTDLYEAFSAGDVQESVYEHCKRAINAALVFGDHGLPLMGTGDWNDGMDKVGEEGRGESVWLGFFLSEVLSMFAAVCRDRGEYITAERYEKQRQTLRLNIERNAWDGQWYMRAFFDDGTPLGSSASPECKIDLMSQSWAVMTGAVRARQAYSAADDHLVMREHGVVRLLTPPFDKWDKNPGYIKDYLPGIRENGGQYTHAAAWYVIAAAKLRRKDDALALFQMLNPINHTRTPADVATYKGEPYVMAADVYYDDDHKGRAGWTWYTGTAGWMYQAALVHILGMRIEDGALSIIPCVPDDFGQYTIRYRRAGAEYVITVEVAPGYRGSAWLSLNGGKRVKRVALNHTDGVHEIFACWGAPGHVYSKT
jgi:cellobiose phosphorylase